MRKRNTSSFGTVGIIFTVILIWQYKHLIPYLIVALLLIGLGAIVVNASRNLSIRKRNIRPMLDINTINGLAFEKHIADLLRANGYTKVCLTEFYDYGVDIIAEKDGIRWGVQVKYYSGLVGLDAVRQVVAGLKYYHCDRGMLVTNSHYTTVAVELARSNDCILVDGRDYKRLARFNY